MSDYVDIKEFIKDVEQPYDDSVPAAEEENGAEEEEQNPELDIQKAVVEELAAEKVELNEKISQLEAKFAALQEEYQKSQDKIKELQDLVAKKDEELAKERSREIDLQERNPNALALLDRDVDVPDRFPGESRDHAIEAIRDAREKAEAEGRLRKAQVLEGILLANEPNGTLARKREEMDALFSNNNYIINGAVIEELQKMGISHKIGENYIMPAEIIKRNF